MTTLDLKPTIRIDGQAWPDTIDDDTPALAGVVLSSAHADDSALERTERVTVRLLQRTTDAPDLERGMTLTITLEHGYPYRCVFVGRLTDISATPSRRRTPDGATPVPSVLYTLTAVDMFDELKGRTLSTAGGYLAAEPGWDREGRLATVLAGAGWTIQRGVTANDLPRGAELPTQTQAWDALALLDDTLRGHARRRNPWVTRDAGGVLARVLELHDDPRVGSGLDYLIVNPDGTWTSVPSGVGAGQTVRIPTSAIPLESQTWTKRAEGYLTDVDIVTWASPDHTKREEVVRAASSVLDLAAVQAARGRTSARVVTGVENATVTADQLRTIARYYIPAAALAGESAPWVLERFIARGDRLPGLTVRDLLTVNTRGLRVVTIGGPLMNAPAGAGHHRGAVVALTATWAHGRWDLEFHLSRPPLPAAGGSWWTPARVAGDLTDPGIPNATCATVGADLTFADFDWIGAP